MFNREQWHKFKVEPFIWDDLIMYAKASWERVVKQVKISIFLGEVVLQGFDQACGVLTSFVEDENHLELEMARQLGSSTLSWSIWWLCVWGGGGGVYPWWGCVGVNFYMAVFHV